MHPLQYRDAVPVRDLVQPRVDLRQPARVESVRVQVEWAGLEGRLEDVGHVGEEDVVEEVAEQGANDAAFAVVALVAQTAVVRQAHRLHRAFAERFERVEPNCFGAAAGFARVAAAGAR